jgi:allantoinase
MNNESFDLVVRGKLALSGGDFPSIGWLGIRGGRIAAISDSALNGEKQIDAGEKLILPGFVDAHVHCRSCEEEGITATTKAAAAGGTTTLIDMPFDRPDRPVNSAERLKQKIDDISREAVIDVGLYVTFPPTGPLDQIAPMAALGAAGYKVSTIEVDPVRFPRIPDGRFVEAFKEIARTGRPVAAHQENQEIIFSETDRFVAAGRFAPLDHALSRPAVAETEAAGRLLEFAHWTGAHLHMVHGTVPRTFDLINWNRSQGVNATGETCLQYLLLTQDALTQQGGRAKCNPPLRTQEDVRGLWERIANGQIDIVTSDHSPYPLFRKETESIFDAYAGIPGAETLGQLLYSEAVAKGRIGLSRFLELVCSGPADIFGFSNKGRLMIGADADFVAFDPNAEWVVDEEKLHYEVGVSAYTGMNVKGKVDSTWVRGQKVYADGQVTGAAGTGTFVPSKLAKKG